MMSNTLAGKGVDRAKDIARGTHVSCFNADGRSNLGTVSNFWVQKLLTVPKLLPSANQ